MIIGQSAGVAAAMALRNGQQVCVCARVTSSCGQSLRAAWLPLMRALLLLQAVQDMDVAALQRRLRELGQIIDLNEE